MKKSIAPPKIIFEDKHLVVLSKPAGLLSQGEETGDNNLVDWLRDYFDRHYVGLVHRLDRNTSGAMVVAKRTKAARRLTESLTSGKLSRTYRALLFGTLSKKTKWQHYLLKDPQKNKVKVFKKSQPKSKEALLTLKAIGQGKIKEEVLSFIEFTLETGRSHQIRAQAAYEGYPLLGDVKYGIKKHEALSKSFKRLALHSYEISFPHPMSSEVLKFTDPLPDCMQNLILS